MALITRPCYCTREQLRRAIDITRAASQNDQIDRAIISGSELVDERCKRRFFPIDATYKFDWPNYQYAYPWRLWLDQYEMAAQPTQVVTGTFLPTPIVIPTGTYIMQPYNSGPPYTSLELRRDQSVGFGANTTPQQDIGITGTFGYWMQTRAAGMLAASVGSSDSTIQVSNSNLIAPGDLVVIDSERLIVTDSSFVTTGVTFSAGITSASAADNTGIVPNGGVFAVGEVLLIDSEYLLIIGIIGNNLIVKRAWDGSVLAAHAGGTVYAARLFSVLRGQLGTTTAAHSNGTAIVVSDVPGLVRDLALAEALMQIVSEPGAYMQSVAGLGAGSGQGVTIGGMQGQNQVKVGIPGAGLPLLQWQMDNSRYARKARTRVV